MLERLRQPPAKVAFHIGLVAGVVPFLSAPALWIAAFWNRALRRRDAQQQLWTRRLFAFAALETLVLAVLMVTVATGIFEEATTEPPPPPRIGALLEETPHGLRVEGVIEGSPASEAGIEPGQVIRSVNGEPIESREEFASQLAEGQPAELELSADGGSTTVLVTPTTNVEPPTVVETEPGTCEEMGAPAAPSPWALVPYAVFLLVAVALSVLGRRRGVPQAVVWLPLLGVFLLAGLIGGLSSWLGCRLAGAGLRGQSVGLALGELALTILAVGWLVVARRRRHIIRPRPPEPRLSTLQGYGLGAFYAAAWMIRVAVLTAPLVWLSRHFGVGETSPVLGDLLGGGADDPIQAAMVFAAAVVLAPIAEESIFRGVLFPHLARSLSPWAAIVWTAILFGMLHVAHGVLLIGPLTLGFVLGWTRWRTGSLGAPILLHTTINGTATLLSWAGS